MKTSGENRELLLFQYFLRKIWSLDQPNQYIRAETTSYPLEPKAFGYSTDFFLHFVVADVVLHIENYFWPTEPKRQATQGFLDRSCALKG